MSPGNKAQGPGKHKGSNVVAKVEKAVHQARVLARSVTGSGKGKGGGGKSYRQYYEDAKPWLQKNVPKGSMSAIGSMLGAGLGGPAGMGVGAYAGGQMAELLGWGDYSVKNNSLATASGALPMGEEVPKFGSSGRGTRIVHREYVGDIISSGTDFKVTSYGLSPLNAKLFPWMSTIAQLYQQYKFNGMVFEFKSMSSEFASGAALGTVIMATNYNANQKVFDTKMEMENTEFSVSAKPSLSQVHCIECDPNERVTEYLYVQPESAAGLVGVSDARLTSFGNFQFATAGVTAPVASTIGEIWVSYDITFLKPVINAYPFNFCSTTLTASVGVSYTGAIFGTGPSIVSSFSPAFTFSPLLPNSLTFSTAGVYQVFLTLLSSFAASGFVSLPTVPGGGSAVIKNSVVGSAAVQNFGLMYMYTIVTVSDNTVVTWAGTGTSLGATEVKAYRVDLANSVF